MVAYDAHDRHEAKSLFIFFVLSFASAISEGVRANGILTVLARRWASFF